MGLNIYSEMPAEVRNLTKRFCSTQFYDKSRDNFRYLIENMGSLVTYRRNIIEFAVASITLPTWCAYSCLVTSAHASGLRAGDLADRLVWIPQKPELEAFVVFCKETAQLEPTQVIGQVGFLTQAIQFINGVDDLKCYEHCQEKCEGNHPSRDEAYWECFKECMQKEQC